MGYPNYSRTGSWNATVLNWAQAISCVKVSSILAIVFTLPVITYGPLYEANSINILAINFFHMLTGYILVGSVLSFFRDK